MSAAAEKKRIRRLMRARLAAVPTSERAAASEALCRIVRGHPLWREAESVMLFAPMPEELDIWPLAEEAWAKGRRVAFPKYAAERSGYLPAFASGPEDLAPGRFGIQEPIGPPSRGRQKLDLIFVPGLAFDFEGRRLGRGKGYYDRLLSTLEGIFCGVAMEFQLLSALPEEKHDRRMNWIATPDRWLAARRPTD